jgi:hypothetical protein
MIVTVTRHQLHVNVLAGTGALLLVAHVQGIHVCFFSYLTLLFISKTFSSFPLFSECFKAKANKQQQTTKCEPQFDNYTPSWHFSSIKEFHK